ncbi:MAG: hypothetical protein JNK11_01285 [Alphaproteobacteria bacterium]|nr:hypothetical protein [Alphaproteobacteria bacterium]
MQRILALSIVVAALVTGAVATADEPRTLVYPRATEALRDPRDDYPVGLLGIALRKAGIAARLRPTDDVLQQSEAVLRLRQGQGVDVVFAGDAASLAAVTRMVPIPLTRGLLGHRLLLIRRADQPRFDLVRAREDLRRIRMAQGRGWPDMLILADAGIPMEEAPYDALFDLVAASTVVAVPRGVVEIYAEIAARAHTHPDLVAESGLVLAYKYDMFFHLRREDGELAAAIESGLRAAHADGSFQAYFRASPVIRDALSQAKLASRRRIELDNALLSPAARAIPDEFWHADP